MRKSRYIFALSLIALLLAWSLPATASEAPMLTFAPGVAEKLEAVGGDLYLFWGAYRHT